VPDFERPFARRGEKAARLKVSLEFDELVVALWPCPAFRCHSAIMTYRQHVGGAFASYPWCGEG
jgi:hypothetical protein